jgi:hypothetical protein
LEEGCVAFIGLYLLRPLFLNGLFFGSGQFYRQGRDNLLGDSILQREDILHAAVISLSPDMMAGHGVDELGINPDFIAGLRTLPSST